MGSGSMGLLSGVALLLLLLLPLNTQSVYIHVSPPAYLPFAPSPRALPHTRSRPQGPRQLVGGAAGSEWQRWW